MDETRDAATSLLLALRARLHRMDANPRTTNARDHLRVEGAIVAIAYLLGEEDALDDLLDVDP